MGGGQPHMVAVTTLTTPTAAPRHAQRIGNITAHATVRRSCGHQTRPDQSAPDKRLFGFLQPEPEEIMLIGYARVSTYDQDTAMQRDALLAAGVKLPNLYQEHASGVRYDRPMLNMAIQRLQPDDTLVFWKLDRVARSLNDLLRVIERIDAMGATVRSLTEPIDTTTSMGVFTIQMLGAFAELERSLIRERCAAGREAAMSRGVKFGRPSAMTPEQQQKALDLRAEGMRPVHIAELLDQPYWRIQDLFRRQKQRRI
jgi:DNA invertase Pin-like site-specific DNA recombinase